MLRAMAALDSVAEAAGSEADADSEPVSSLAEPVLVAVMVSEAEDVVAVESPLVAFSLPQVTDKQPV